MEYIIAQAALAYMRKTYGRNMLPNFERSTPGRMCFDQSDQSGDRFIRKYLSLPNWDCESATYEVDKRSGTEIRLAPVEEINKLKNEKE